MLLVLAWIAVALWATLLTEWHLRRHRDSHLERRTWGEALLVVARLTYDECWCGHLGKCPACRSYEAVKRVVLYRARRAGEKDSRC